MTQTEIDLIWDNEDKRHKPEEEYELWLDSLFAACDDDQEPPEPPEEPSEFVRKQIETVNKIIDSILDALKKERGLKKERDNHEATNHLL